MLEIRPNCECCNVDIAPVSNNAFICSFECTFCKSCTESKLGFKCPNCGGELVRRPSRSAQLLAKYPASDKRVFNPNGCVTL